MKFRGDQIDYFLFQLPKIFIFQGGLNNFEKMDNSMILPKLHTGVRVLATSLFVRIG